MLRFHTTLLTRHFGSRKANRAPQEVICSSLRKNKGGHTSTAECTWYFFFCSPADWGEKTKLRCTTFPRTRFRIFPSKYFHPVWCANSIRPLHIRNPALRVAGVPFSSRGGDSATSPYRRSPLLFHTFQHRSTGVRFTCLVKALIDSHAGGYAGVGISRLVCMLHKALNTRQRFFPSPKQRERE